MAGRDTTETLERGSIYFFYRPKIGQESPGSIDDVQRTYMVLKPVERDVYRLAVLGRKRMPEVDESGDRGKDRTWGFIDLVAHDPTEIRQALEERDYETKTRGERSVPAARPVGEGVYRLVRHGDHTHLAYALKEPRHTGEPQEELGLEPEGSFIMSVKNPEAPGVRKARLPRSPSGREPSFPPELRDRFGGRRFADVDPPGFLDVEAAEFVLISAAEDVEQELGLTLEPSGESRASADVSKDLGIDRTRWPVAPLFEGRWE